MARKGILPTGTPVKPIDWKLVEERMGAGCSLEEIAGKIGVCRHTLGYRFQQQYGVPFSTAILEYKEGRNGDLRWKQFQQAMRGNTTLLVKLGDVYLGQAQKNDVAPNDEKLNEQIAESKELGELEEYKKQREDFLKWKALQDGSKPEAESECLPSDQTV